MDKLEGREDRAEGVQWSKRSSRGVESARDGYIETGEWGRGEIDVPCFISTVDRKTMPSSPQQRGLLPTSQLCFRTENVNLMGRMPAPG